MKPLKELSPIEAAKKVFMMKLVDEFKDFVSDSFDEGLHEDFEDHMEFMSACLETFMELKNDEIIGE